MGGKEEENIQANFGSQTIAEMEESARFTFGYERAEIVGALINCGFLFGICMEILMDAFSHVADFMSRGEFDDNEKKIDTGIGYMFFIGTLGLAMNIFGLCLFGHHHHHGHLGGHHHGCDGHEHGNKNLGHHHHHHNHHHHDHHKNQSDHHHICDDHGDQDQNHHDHHDDYQNQNETSMDCIKTKNSSHAHSNSNHENDSGSK